MKRTVKSRGPGYDIMRALYRNKLAMICLVIIVQFCIASCIIVHFANLSAKVRQKMHIRKQSPHFFEK